MEETFSDDVLAKYSAISGKLSPSSAETTLCTSAATELTNRLSEDSMLTAYGDELAFAAAATAYYRYILSSGLETESFKAGEVQYETDTAAVLDAARELYNSAMRAVSHCLKGNTVFKSIGGGGL